jgi:Holliday junction DNA helicase RuvA
MIAFLTGRVAGKTANSCLLEVSGVGYRLAMSTTSLAALPAEGDEVTVWTYLYVREDELSLYGFESVPEKDAFELLITVSGVGPKVALAALSALSPDDLAAAVAAEDLALLSGVPGIGRKTAQRICLELKDKMGVPDLALAQGGKGTGAAASAEATEALLSMGFSSAEVSASLKGFDGDSSNAQALLRHALQRLGGSGA